MEWILIFISSSGLAAICSYPSASVVFHLSVQLMMLMMLITVPETALSTLRSQEEQSKPGRDWHSVFPGGGSSWGSFAVGRVCILIEACGCNPGFHKDLSIQATGTSAWCNPPAEMG